MTLHPNLQQAKTPSTSLILAILFILSISFKLLLIPTYKSTDFDVHRNWLAITKNLPLHEWYFYDCNGKTKHTLDYPPSFAFFEYLLASNIFTNFLIRKGYLNENCLFLLADDENHQIGYDCVVFQRCTVIFVADLILWIGAYWLCVNLYSFDHDSDTSHHLFDRNSSSTTTTDNTIQQKQILVTMILIVFNTGLLMLDHIHFQYNGMMIGILLASVGCFVKAMRFNTPTTFKLKIWYEILGSVLFASLLTFKHLYITLAPLYFFYLLRRFCYCTGKKRVVEIVVHDDMKNMNKYNQDEKEQNDVHDVILHFSWRLFWMLAISVLITVSIPFIPFFISTTSTGSSNIDRISPKVQLLQIISRLFPFQRGLCHDYWAGNVWALYLGFERIICFLGRLLNIHTILIPFPQITPKLTALLLILGLIPAIISAWKVATISLQSKNTNECIQGCQQSFLYCVVFSALSSFMLAFHVHEKAIMTAIIPMTYLAVTSRKGARLYLRMSTIGHFGIMPLLYRKQEIFLKLILNSCFLSLAVWLLQNVTNTSVNKTTPKGRQKSKTHDHTSDDVLHLNDVDESLVSTGDKIGIFLIVIILIFSEIIHPLLFRSRGILEFLPLMIISMFSAMGLIGCWVHCGKIMVSSKLPE